FQGIRIKIKEQSGIEYDDDSFTDPLYMSTFQFIGYFFGLLVHVISNETSSYTSYSCSQNNSGSFIFFSNDGSCGTSYGSADRSSLHFFGSIARKIQRRTKKNECESIY